VEKRRILSKQFTKSNEMIFPLFLVVFLCFSSLLTGSEAFASWMTSDFCDRQLKVGEVIMNEEVQLSDDRHIEVFRDSQPLTSNKDSFILGEVLTVKVSNPLNQYVYEISGNSEAKFLKGGCEGKRIADKPQVILQAPETNNNDPVNIVIGWAEGHSTVSVSRTFTLLSPNSKNAADAIPSSLEIDNSKQDVPGQQKGDTSIVDSAEAAPADVEEARAKSELSTDLRVKNSQEENSPLVEKADKPENLLLRRNEGNTCGWRVFIVSFLLFYTDPPDFDPNSFFVEDGGNSAESFQEEENRAVKNKRRFKRMKERVIYKATMYIILIAVTFFSLAFIIRYRHNITRSVMKSLGYKIVEE
jgi:hypothetical protein